jgi:hypothetical protein
MPEISTGHRHPPITEDHPMSQTIIEKVISEAVRNLTSCGCKFAVVTPDGRKLGELSIDEPKKKHRLHNFKATGYQSVIDSMKPGDVSVFEAGEFKPEDFRKAIIARAVGKFGAGNATSTINGDKIELLRLA